MKEGLKYIDDSYICEKDMSCPRNKDAGSTSSVTMIVILMIKCRMTIILARQKHMTCFTKLFSTDETTGGHPHINPLGGNLPAKESVPTLVNIPGFEDHLTPAVENLKAWCFPFHILESSVRLGESGRLQG